MVGVVDAAAITREGGDVTESAPYYPPPESQGGWRWLTEPDDVRAVAGLEPVKLDVVLQRQELLHSGFCWSIVIIRHGYLARELHTPIVSPSTRFDVWSCTKSFTGTAWGLLLDDCRHGRLHGHQQVSLDSPAYAFIPEGHPLTDPRKERITIKHLLTMTSGIRGEEHGLFAVPAGPDSGPFEYALGRCANRNGKWVDKLASEPGQGWDYSDPAIVHLALAFAHIAGREMSDYLHERVLEPIGIEGSSWDAMGGRGFIGPHTKPHTGMHISARELARFGYLALHGGRWGEELLIPDWWHTLATRASQDMNPSYGYTWWVNSEGAMWPGLPRDAFALAGYASSRCFVIPSLDLVVARVGSGPPTGGEQGLIEGIVEAIVRED